jgi:hypothetical protein
MALSITKSPVTTPREGDLRDLVVQFNALLDTLRAIGVIYDADAGITSTAFVSTLEAGVSKIGDRAGTARSTTTG